MVINDFQGEWHGSDDAHIERVLMRRYGDGLNHFWLSHPGREYPRLSIAVRKDFAALHYFPRDGHAGFQSLGAGNGLDPSELTAFAINAQGHDDIEVMNGAIVPFAAALVAAKEFAVSDALPRCIEWFEL